MENNISKHPNARNGPDIILRVLDIGSVILWGFLIVNLVIILLAKPLGETFFDRLLNISVRDYWDTAILQIALFLSLFQLVLSIVSLYLNSKRLKRKNDRIRISIIVSIFGSLAICLYLTLFLYLT